MCEYKRISLIELKWENYDYEETIPRPLHSQRIHFDVAKLVLITFIIPKECIKNIFVTSSKIRFYLVGFKAKEENIVETFICNPVYCSVNVHHYYYCFESTRKSYYDGMLGRQCSSLTRRSRDGLRVKPLLVSTSSPFPALYSTSSAE